MITIADGFQQHSRCGSLTPALLLWTPWATNCRRAAPSSCWSPSKCQRSCSMTTARHPGTLSFCSRRGAAHRPSSTPLWKTMNNGRRTRTERTKRRPCSRSRQCKSSCRWTMGAWWRTSCPPLTPRCPRSSQRPTTMVILRTRQVWVCSPVLLKQITLAFTKEATWQDTAEEISVRPHHVTLLLITPCNTPQWWPSPTAGSCNIKPSAPTLDTTATCRTSTTAATFSASTPTLSPVVICPSTSSHCWSGHICPLLG